MARTAHVVSLNLTFDAEPLITPDGVSDLMATIVDALDEAGFIPNLSAAGAGESFRLTVEVLVPGPDLGSYSAGVDAIRNALAVAGIDAAGPTVWQPTFIALQPA